jgi:hypothetical protein
VAATNGEMKEAVCSNVGLLRAFTLRALHCKGSHPSVDS